MSPAIHRLLALGLTLPIGVTAAARYTPAMRAGDFLHLSGQIPRQNGVVAVAGVVGVDIDLAQACHGARICALRLMGAAADVLGSLELIVQVASLTVYVRAAHDFTDISTIADSASDLLIQVLGEAGRHARTAVGVAQLPAGAAVEITATLLIRNSRNLLPADSPVV